MKYFLVITLALVMYSCKETSNETGGNQGMSGVYELHTIPHQGGVKDLMIPAQKQVKIYTDKYYMYVTTRPDSSASFGFGAYKFYDSTLAEQNIFNSSTLDSASQKISKLSRSDSGYIQVQTDIKLPGSEYGMDLAYNILPETESTDLDGAWELTSFIDITGSDTTVIPNRQFKIYKGGHFMWIHRYPADPSGQTFNNGYGYGKFIIRKNTVTETIAVSNYHEAIEVPITINFKLNDNNELSLIVNDGNSTTKETYKRLN